MQVKIQVLRDIMLSMWVCNFWSFSRLYHLHLHSPAVHSWRQHNPSQH